MWGVALFLILLNASFTLWQYDLYSGTGLILWSLADPLLCVSVFPILMALCAEKVEGSQFTAYMAMINLCDVVGSYVTGWTIGSISAPMLGLGCGLFIVLLLLVVRRNNTYSIIPG